MDNRERASFKKVGELKFLLHVFVHACGEIAESDLCYPKAQQ